MYRYFLITVVLLLGHVEPCWAQRIVSLAESFTINPYTAGKIECLLPQDQAGRQSILSIQVTRPPDDTILKHGGLYAVWEIVWSSEVQQISVVTTLRLSENSLRKASNSKSVLLESEELSMFVQPEEMIQSADKEIERTAAELIGNNDRETVRNVFNFTIDHLEYYQFFNQRQGAKKALRKGRGDCTEYAELMVALLRNLGIPARKALGHTIHQQKEQRVGYHSWVEVYFEKLGWVSFDPTWADHEKTYTKFDKMENAYILLGYGHSAARNRPRVSGGDFQVDYNSDWEDPALLIEGRVHSALWQDDLLRANNSLDTLIAWLPDNAKYIALRAKAVMVSGAFEEAFPLIQLSIRKAQDEWTKQNCMRNLASYMANTGKEKEALALLLALEKKNEYSAVPASTNRLLSPLSDEVDFQSLVERGKTLSKKLYEEMLAREAKAANEKQ
ncbi:MAG: transglutaminase family protein [Lewinella sp.]